MKYIHRIILFFFAFTIFLGPLTAVSQVTNDREWVIAPSVSVNVPVTKQMRDKWHAGGSLMLNTQVEVLNNLYLGAFIGYFHYIGKDEKSNIAEVKYPNLQTFNYGLSLKKRFITAFIQGDAGFSKWLHSGYYYYLSPSIGVDFNRSSFSIGAPITFQYDRDIKPYGSIEFRYLRKIIF